jgi:hypothetical protein
MILEHFSLQLPIFRPTDIRQYTVLQIARKFTAKAHLKDYLLAAERHSLPKLIQAYHTARPAQDKQSAFFQTLNH